MLSKKEKINSNGYTPQKNITLTRHDAGLFRELDTLDRLQQSLPDNYKVFHSINWFTTRNSQDQHGEIDVVVMSPEGNFLLMEIKAGDVILRNGEIFKTYNESESNVSRQCKFQYSAIINRLSDAKLHPFVTNCLVLPDYKIHDAKLVSFTIDRIISAEDYDFLGSKVQEILRSAQARANVDQIRSFLLNEFKVTTDLSVLKGQIGTAVHQLSDGMSTWIPRVVSPSGIIHIKATAGSGKTQLALKLLNDVASLKHKSLYICFNRPLADYLSTIAPVSSRVTNFHELCIDQLKRKSNIIDFESADIFEKAVIDYIDSAPTKEPVYDLIIIDECQDFQPAWVNAVMHLLKTDGRLYLMEDPDQCLYTRDDFEIKESVIITCNDNYRSPQSICEVINAFGLSSSPISTRNPYKGEFPEFHLFSDEKSLISKTEIAIESLIAKGFSLQDIVVLTAKGRVKSKVLSREKIGKFNITKFSGIYTPDGDPKWSSGDLKAETVYRFKGQSSPAIVLTEIDFEEMTNLERNKMFVGITRAQMAVEIVLSVNTESWFSKKLSTI